MTSNPASNDLVERLRGRVIPWHIGQAAADEIERLRRELAEAKRHRDNAIDKFNSEYDATRYLLASNDRLRAALERIATQEFSEEDDREDVGWQDCYWIVVNIAREALAGQGSDNETNPRLGVERSMLERARPCVKESRDHWDWVLLAQEKAPRSNAAHMLPDHYIGTLREQVQILDRLLEQIDGYLAIPSAETSDER